MRNKELMKEILHVKKLVIDVENAVYQVSKQLRALSIENESLNSSIIKLKSSNKSAVKDYKRAITPLVTTTPGFNSVVKSTMKKRSDVQSRYPGTLPHCMMHIIEHSFPDSSFSITLMCEALQLRYPDIKAKRGSINSILSKLAKEGNIERVGHGIYRKVQ